MAQVRAIDAHRLAILQAAHIVPNYLLVAEARPPVVPALVEELLNRPASRRNEKWLARHTVVVSNLAAISLGFLYPSARALEGIAAALG